jgi:ribosome-associated protein
MGGAFGMIRFSDDGSNMNTQPPPYSTDPDELALEVEVTVYRASGPGGQHRNTTDSAVRLHHPPSGVTVIAADNRSQLRNRKLAMERLIERLRLLNRKPKRRKPTRATAASRHRRLDGKRKQSERKRLRRRPDED